MADDPAALAAAAAAAAQQPNKQGDGTQNQQGQQGNQQSQTGNNGQGEQGGKKPDPGASIYQQVGLEEPGTKGSATWPDTWRDQFKGVLDNKDSKIFDRMSDPIAVAKSYAALVQRISSGEFKATAKLADGATPEQVEAWRKDNGLPAKPEDYQITPKGVKPEDLNDKAKATIGEFAKAFHTAGLNQEQATTTAQAIYDFGMKAREAEVAADAQRADGAEDEARAGWGAEYRANMQMNIGHLEKVFGKEIAPQFMEARLPDGRRLGDIFAVSKAVNEWARGDGGDVLYSGGEGAGKGIEARIAEIKSLMGTPKYTNEVSAEYLKLLEKQEARAGRG